MIKSIIDFFCNLFFGKPIVPIKNPEEVMTDDRFLIDPMDLPKFSNAPEPAQVPAVKKEEEPKKSSAVFPDGPMRLKRGERLNRTNRGFYRGYFGPVIRV